MQLIYRNFYRSAYLNTGGLMAPGPLNRPLLPGDFFQVRNGATLVLGNIYSNGIIQPEETDIAAGITMNPAGWNFGDGVSKAYSGRGAGESATGGEFEYSRQVLAFRAAGSFMFAGYAPEMIKINNWSDIGPQLIIRMTQTMYSFREVYVVTEAVSLLGATLAVAGAPGAELEIATEEDNFGLVDIFGQHKARTIQSRDIEYYHRTEARRPFFFRARKLTVRDEKKQIMVSQLAAQAGQRRSWYNGFFEAAPGYTETGEMYEAGQECVLDLLQAQQLNPNTALQYFTWAEANMDDVEKMFITYGNIG
jgi:hypothetical protein